MTDGLALLYYHLCAFGALVLIYIVLALQVSCAVIVSDTSIICVDSISMTWLSESCTFRLGTAFKYDSVSMAHHVKNSHSSSKAQEYHNNGLGNKYNHISRGYHAFYYH